MKINKFQLLNFRSHVDTTLGGNPIKNETPLPSFIVFRGANHRGKTSIVQGIEIGLAGRSESTDERGAGAKDLIRTDSPDGKASIRMIFQNDPNSDKYRALRCVLSDKGREAFITDPGDDKNLEGAEKTSNWLKNNRDVVSCCVNGRRFVDLEPKEQKIMLANIVLPASYDWDIDTVSRIRTSGLIDSFNPKGSPFDVIAKMYKASFDARRDLKRDIGAFEMPSGDTSMAGDVQRVRDEIAELHSKKSGAEAIKETIIKESSRRETAAKLLADQLRDANTELSTEQQQVDMFTKKVIPKARLKDVQALAAKKDNALELEASIAKAQRELEDVESALKMVQQLDRTPNCPRCHQEVSEEQVQTIARPLLQKKNALLDQIKEEQKARQNIGDYEGAVKELAIHEAAKTDKARSDGRVVEAHTKIEQINKKIAELGTQASSEDQLDEVTASIQKYEQDISEKRERITPIVQANTLKDAIEKGRVKVKEMNDRLLALEWLVTYFGTGESSLQTKLLSEHVGGFQTDMNAILAAWGYECVLQFDPFVFGIKRGEKVLGLHLLSGSEKHQFAVAFQVALALQSGFLFAVVDTADIYDQDQRKDMFTALLNAGLDQVWVLGTDTRTNLPADLTDKAYFMLNAEQNAEAVMTTTVTRMLPE